LNTEKAELTAAKRRAAKLETELAIHRRARAAGEGGARKRRFEAIAVMAGEGLAVQMAARVLDVSESGYYEFRRIWWSGEFDRTGPNKLRSPTSPSTTPARAGCTARSSWTRRNRGQTIW
jgi:hypothetical protein